MLDREKYEKLKSDGTLPSPKGSALRVIELCQDHSISLPDIIQAIQTDPGMVGRVLKMANSPVFGHTRPVVSLTPDVLITIGIHSLRQAVLAFSLVSDNRSGRCASFDYQAFWSHSIAMGVAAQLLSSSIRVAPPMEMFTCGLLAQIGRLALATIHPASYSDLLKNLATASLTDQEQETFGLSHVEVSAAMMSEWGIPKLFTDAVLFHEAPEQGGVSDNTRSGRLLWSIHLAWRLANSCMMSEEQRKAQFPELIDVARKLDMDTESIMGIGNRMLEEWREWSALLEIATPSVADFSMMDLPSHEVVDTDQSPVANQHPETARDNVSVPISILLVDDDPATLLMLKKVLSTAGCTVHTANNSTQALQLTLTHRPHIIITDWFLPEFNGLELIRTLRDLEIGQSLYIMVLTALDDKEKLAEAFDAGADDFLVKPVDLKIFQARLKAGLRVVHAWQEMEEECDRLKRETLRLSITNRQSEEAALTDSLTRLYNRRYAMKRLTTEWVGSSRNEQPLSLLVLDVDHFKNINDTYGHHVGDEVLKRLAEMLVDFTRSPDVACRIGGEEFCILAPATPLSGALNQAERLRKTIEQQVIVVGDISLKLTVSIGVAQKLPGLTDVVEMIKLADEALYRAKREGRNRVVAAAIE